jgi:hypothetical protein
MAGCCDPPGTRPVPRACPSPTARTAPVVIAIVPEYVDTRSYLRALVCVCVLPAVGTVKLVYGDGLAGPAANARTRLFFCTYVHSLSI